MRDILKLGVGFNEGALRTLLNITVEAWVTVRSVFVNIIVILGGITVQVPMLVPEHDEPEISMIDGAVIVTVPLGVIAGRM